MSKQPKEVEDYAKVTFLRTHSERIIQLRKEMGLTQAELASILDISDQTVSLIERGLQSLQPDKAVKLHSKYGYSLDWIYGTSESEKGADADTNHLVDIRDVFRVDGDTLHISIRCYLYDYLQELAQIFQRKKDKSISGKEFSILFASLEKQLAKKGPQGGNYYCADIGTRDLKRALILKRNCEPFFIAE